MKDQNAQQQKTLTLLSRIVQVQSLLTSVSLDVEKFMTLVVEQMQILTPATGAVIELVEGDEMVYKAATGTVAKHVGLRLKRGTSISGLCVATGEILLVKDSEQDSRVNLEACRLVQAYSMVVTPLFHDREAIGVLKIVSKSKNAFNEEDIKTLELMAGFLGSALMHQIMFERNQILLKERNAVILDLKRAEKKLQRLATYDSLTSLPNRRLLLDRLSTAIKRAKRKQSLLAVFFLDIDHFKNVNDTLGHEVGDELLRAFSGRIKKTIRKSDTLARLGGDEFVIVLEELSEEKAAYIIAEKIIQKMQEPIQLKNTTLTINTSIGISFLTPEVSQEEVLIKQADKALYEAKREGRNAYRVYKH